MLKIKLKKKVKKVKDLPKKKFTGKGLKIVDEDSFASGYKPASEESDVSDVEELPQIAAVVDERPVEVQAFEEFKKGKWKRIEDEDPAPMQRKRDSDSGDQSPPRIRSVVPGASARDRKVDKLDDFSPPRQRKRRDSDDQSPPRRRDVSSSRGSISSFKRRDRDRNEDKVDDSSPPRQRKRRDSDDQSPPRRRDVSSSRGSISSFKRRDRDRNEDKVDDSSPPRQRKRRYSDDQSPPRIGSRKRRNSNDQSPPRVGNRNRRDSDDQSPPRIGSRKRHDSGDQSPPRRGSRAPSIASTSSFKRRDGNRHITDDSSPPRQRKRRDSDDQSPPRRGSRAPSIASTSSFRRRDRDRNVAQPVVLDASDESKASQTLDGKKAGLQRATALRDEMLDFRKRENEMFELLPDEVSGRNAKAVVRDRRTEEDRAKEVEKARKEAERKEQYNKWGKGLTQVKEQEANVRSAMHEMAKPLARYKDDDDLDVHLKTIDREGDPMLEYLTAKRRKASGVPEKPRYKGPPPPINRFNIPPGYRWDGVDRSNGYEKEWFSRINSKKAYQEEAYKWSVEDL